MDPFIEQQEAELLRKLVAEFDAEAAATGGPTYEEVQRAWQEWREQQKVRMNPHDALMLPISTAKNLHPLQGGLDENS